MEHEWVFKKTTYNRITTRIIMFTRNSPQRKYMTIISHIRITDLAHQGSRAPSLAEILRQEIPVGLNRTTAGIRNKSLL